MQVGLGLFPTVPEKSRFPTVAFKRNDDDEAKQ